MSKEVKIVQNIFKKRNKEGYLHYQVSSQFPAIVIKAAGYWLRTRHQMNGTEKERHISISAQ